MTTERLKIIIVGSGLAGLTAARILRPHHNVTVYERGSASVATGGQGIMIAPNSIKILESINFDRARAGGVPIRGIRTYLNREVKEEVSMGFKSRFGADSVGMKRSDFREELLRLATEDLKEGKKVYMKYGGAVTGLDCEQGVVELADGSTDSADVVIIADGVHSRLRNVLLESESYAPNKAGLTCYRVAISTKDAQQSLNDLPLPHWWEPSTCQNRTSLIYAPDGTPRFITAYPICNETMFNLSCLVRSTPSTRPTTESWHADGDKAQMISAFQDFGEDITRILDAASEIKVWELQDLSTLPTWTRGRAILIGDAAHAMTPMQGQGANMSIEDAEAFRLLTPGTTRVDVPAVLWKIGEVRRKRVERVLEETRKVHSTVGVAERMFKNADLYYGYNGIVDAMERESQEA
ncbi:FAD binding domain protein [Polyplosphaeria fusca]|uniref:FAD binding domain protein n=1 Tax=Polyplosphaeria fusca TaxID=682080 RepID=A0A9P4QX72_9PLEO|nr:FAD binding domain protein [Polyplosphaeria fusca]